MIGNAVHLVGQVIASFGRDLLGASVRDGRLRTAGLPRGVRVGVLVAYGLAIAVFVSIVFGDSWRTFDPVVLSSGQVLRGTVIPTPLVPLTMLVVTLGGALCVSGAIRAVPWVSAGVGTLYVVVATFVHGFAPGSGWVHTLAGWCIVGVIVVLIGARHLPPHPVAELLIAIVLVGITFAEASRALAQADAASGKSLLGDQTHLILTELAFFAAPLVIAAALGTVSFGATTARWGLDVVDRHMGKGLLVAIALILAAWRLRDAIDGAFTRAGSGGWPGELRAIVGAIVLLSLIGGAAALLGRHADDDRERDDPKKQLDAASRLALPAAIVATGLTLTAGTLALLLQGITPLLSSEQSRRAQDWISEAIDTVVSFGGSDWWTVLRIVITGLAAFALARAGRAAASCFAAAVCLVLLYALAADPSQPLESWAWTPEAVDVVVVVACAAMFVVWAVRRELTVPRIERLLFLLLLTGLLRQEGFLSDPLTSLIPFSGAAFVLVGLIWGFATGLSWANEDSPKLPRFSRAQMLMGYQILSLAILHWVLVSHDLGAVDNLTSRQPGIGTLLLARPMLLVLIITIAIASWRNVGFSEETDRDPAPVQAAAE